MQSKPSFCGIGRVKEVDLPRFRSHLCGDSEASRGYPRALVKIMAAACVMPVGAGVFVSIDPFLSRMSDVQPHTAPFHMLSLPIVWKEWPPQVRPPASAEFTLYITVLDVLGQRLGRSGHRSAPRDP